MGHLSPTPEPRIQLCCNKTAVERRARVHEVPRSSLCVGGLSLRTAAAWPLPGKPSPAFHFLVPAIIWHDHQAKWMDKPASTVDWSAPTRHQLASIAPDKDHAGVFACSFEYQDSGARLKNPLTVTSMLLSMIHQGQWSPRCMPAMRPARAPRSKRE
jgi:hypothetical protein